MDRIIIDGLSYRVEVNWNTIVHFLEATGRDNVQELASLTDLRPSDLAGLLAASINEGERLDGKQVAFSAEDIGGLVDFATMAEFIAIFTRQTSPKGGSTGEKKG